MSDPLATAISQYKYGFDVSLAPVLGEFLLLNCPMQLDHDLVVAVPLHPQRLRWRGFNQAALMARRLIRRRDLRFSPRALKRLRNTLPQVGLGEADRRKNMRGAFVAPDPGAVADRAVLLVDDVYTTGATANECSRVLLSAGAKRVDVLVLARAA